MRVAHVLPVYSTNGISLLGGGERYAYNLARALSFECETTLVTFGPRRADGAIDTLRHLVLPARGGNIANPFPTAPFAMLRDFDLVHAYQLRTMATALLAVLCRAVGKPLIVTDLGNRLTALTDKLGVNRLIPRFVSISDYSRDLLPRDVRPRTKVVKGGVDLERFGYNDGPRRRQVLQVGRIMPHKGMNYLIDAFDGDVEVVIAGKVVGAYRHYYEALRERSRGKKVRFLLNPTDEEVASEYRRSAVTVAASVYHDMYGAYRPHAELLGLTLLESMATGTPVICSRIGGMPEFVIDGETGFTVPPNDSAAIHTAASRLLEDADLSRQFGLAGHRHVQQFSWESVAHQVVKQYRALLRGHEAHSVN
jgi:glycosyltransferase involved in cell wall biosynthesis